jgi:hypothetical protein
MQWNVVTVNIPTAFNIQKVNKQLWLAAFHWLYPCIKIQWDVPHQEITCVVEQMSGFLRKQILTIMLN